MDYQGSLMKMFYIGPKVNNTNNNKIDRRVVPFFYEQYN